ncbi:ComEC/Rec2 family competence protein [Algoriphagus namhaensis]
MNFTEFPFLRYLIFFLFGVGLSYWVPDWSTNFVLIFSVLCFLIYAIFHFIWASGRTVVTSGLAYLTLISFGLLFSLFEQSHQKKLQFPEGFSPQAYLAEVQDYDLPKPNSKQNLVQILQVKASGIWRPFDTKVLIYHQLDSGLTPGQLILVEGAPEQVKPTQGPGQFDYQAFLLRKGIAYTHFLGKKVQSIPAPQEFRFDFFVKGIRQQLASRIESSFQSQNIQDIAKALLIGEKRALDPETRSAYARAGVMHVLAVSGLHVGIVYAIFLFLGDSLRLKGNSRRLYFLLVIFILWFYALLTGLSPSVVRASTMFSLLVLGIISERRPPIFNMLGFSALVMVAFNPEVVFDVGFQLSYVAVAGIVLIQPLIVRWWIPRYRVLEYFWQIVAVSLAAQLATFPLSVYYFHYFPTYFLLGNILVLPLAFVIMQLGIPWLVLGPVPILGDVLSWLLDFFIGLQNLLISMISGLPGGEWTRLTITWPSMVAVWLFLLAWSSWRRIPKAGTAWLGILGLAFFSIGPWFGDFSEEILIYPAEKGLLIDYYGQDGLFSYSSGFPEAQIPYVVDPYRLQHGSPLIPGNLKVLERSKEGERLASFDVFFAERQKKTHLSSAKNYHVQRWVEGAWQQIEERDSVTLSSQAIRILP